MLKSIKITIVFIILLLSITTAYAALDFHKPNVCTEGCHQKFPYSDEGEEYEPCDNCHSYKLNVARLESEHNPNICKGCHLVRDKKTLHIVHKDVTCNAACHTVQDAKVSTPKITFTKCESCHTMKVHTLHQDKLSNLCSTCHGGAAGVTITTPSSSSSSSFAISNNTKTDYQRLTLYEMLKSLILNIEGGNV